MIIDKFINIDVHNKTSKYWKNLNYVFEKSGDMIDVLPHHLKPYSKIKVNCKCSNCENLTYVSYASYFNSINNGDKSYVCSKCNIIKSKKTLYSKYGEINPSNIKKFQEKRKDTFIKNCGGHPLSNNDIKNKIKTTNLEKYGVEYGVQDNNIKNKIKITNLEKYGVENHSSLRNSTNVFLNKNENYLINYKILYKNYQKIKLHHLICNSDFTITMGLFYNRIKSNIEVCTNCYPKFSNLSGIENEIIIFIKKYYTLNIIKSNRKILKGKELDIYLPDLNIAFEINGLYWHCELDKNNDYHLNKTEDYLRNNIQLIHIYEDDWLFKKDIVKSMILNLLGKTPNKIYARKCEIKEINNKESKLFLENNNLQGYTCSKINIALYYNDELTTVMTFKNIKNDANMYKMIYFCSKLNYTVIGGASKLFNYFLKRYNPSKIITSVDRNWSIGKLYEKLNFKFISNTKPDYYYVLNHKKENNSKYRKSILIKNGYDTNKTEKEIMLERKIFRIYDSGNINFIYKT